jgi:hypothetical protein
MLNVSSTVVGQSAATETGISAEMQAASAAAAVALTGVVPMGADADSVEFAAALAAAGAAYLGTAAEHSGQRDMFAGGQSLAGATYAVTDAMNNTILAL